jgi:hypothetical protein
MSIDNTKFELAKLCERNHNYEGTGMSLRRKRFRDGKPVLGHCLDCEKEQNATWYANNKERRLQTNKQAKAANPDKK